MGKTPPAQIAPTTVLRRLEFVRFDETFLERSRSWLTDPEVKHLTMTPDFTLEEQQRWFRRLPEMSDYLIWGISCEGEPIGALGLKHIQAGRAEYWGYIGEKNYWNSGFGQQMMGFAFKMARRLGLTELFLKVNRDNSRAIRVYERAGFTNVDSQGDVLKMSISLKDVPHV